MIVADLVLVTFSVNNNFKSVLVLYFRLLTFYHILFDSWLILIPISVWFIVKISRTNSFPGTECRQLQIIDRSSLKRWEWWNWSRQANDDSALKTSDRQSLQGSHWPVSRDIQSVFDCCTSWSVTGGNFFSSHWYWEISRNIHGFISCWN